MRILQVNKFYYPHGGADKYFLNLTDALKKSGQTVAVFSMTHPKNLASEFKQYFVSQIEFNNASLGDKLKAPGRIIYSLEAKRKFKKLVNDFQPDIIHVHNIYHQISPSILDVAKRKGIPVIMHLHDYKLLCPNYQLFTEGQTCEACRPKKYGQCVRKKCFKESLAKSFLASSEMFIHHSLLKIYKKNIALFIAPSNFMKKKVVEFAWPADKVRVVVNPFSIDEDTGKEQGIEENKISTAEDYLLYFGRLSKEKGIETLIKAAALTKTKVKLAGTGPEELRLKEVAKITGAQVDFLGFKNGPELRQIITKAKAVLIPSIWYENMPLSLLEALSLGKIVIAANIGGLPEIIHDGENGFLFEPQNIEDLKAKISLLDTLDEEKKQSIQKRAKESVAHVTPENNLQEILNIYQEILKNKK